MALGGVDPARAAAPAAAGAPSQSRPRPRAVLLDAMGTLLALDDPAAALVKELRERHGLELSREQAGSALAAEIAYYRAHHDEGVDAASLRDLRLRCALALRAELPEPARALPADALVASLLAALRLRRFADAAPALTALRGCGLRLAVVSNWDCSLPHALRELGLTEHLDAVITSAQAGSAKPAPAIFAAALARLAVPPGEAVHVGDSLEHDVAGARASGIRAVLLRRDGSRAPATPPDVAVIDSLAALPALVSCETA